MYSPFDYNLAFHLDFPLRTECTDWVILGPRLLVNFVLFFTINLIPSVFCTFPLETLVFFSLPDLLRIHSLHTHFEEDGK